MGKKNLRVTRIYVSQKETCYNGMLDFSFPALDIIHLLQYRNHRPPKLEHPQTPRPLLLHRAPHLSHLPEMLRLPALPIRHSPLLHSHSHPLPLAALFSLLQCLHADRSSSSPASPACCVTRAQDRRRRRGSGGSVRDGRVGEDYGRVQREEGEGVLG